MTATHCPYCALQCGMNLATDQNGLLTVLARPEFPTNKGGLCQKGWTSAELIGHPDRLTSPLVRDSKGGSLRIASWDEALALITAKITSLQQTHGHDAIGVFGGGGLTNEKAYALGKFARVGLQTKHIDYNGRFCMSSAASAGVKAFGLDRGLPFPLEDIPKTQVAMLSGSNVAETMPPIMQYFDQLKTNGGSLIVTDPRITPTSRAATLHLQLTPGTDIALANGLLHIAAADGLIDHAYIAARTNGYDAVRRVIGSYWPDRVERITGVPVKQLNRAAHLLGESAAAMVLSARGSEQQSKGTDTVLALINLMLALGKPGKLYSGYGCLTGQGNGQGGREHGQKADQLPGYRRIDNPEHRRHIAAVWGVDESEIPGPGKSAYEMLDAIAESDGIRGLLVMGSNVAVSAPKAGDISRKLKSLDLLVVSDIFLSETAQLADIVLPTAQWAEEEGTMTNLEGRVILRGKATQAPDGVRTDLEVIKALADRLGRGNLFTDNPCEVFDELRRASSGGAADYAGITYKRIAAEDGVFWPCPSESHPGTPRLFESSFATEDGRANFHAVVHRPAAEEPCDEYPLYFTTGRIMGHYQSGTQTRRVGTLAKANTEPFAEIHPDLARRTGIVDGGAIRVVSRRGEVSVTARVTNSIRYDTVFMPFHWGGVGSANLLTNPALDPLSKMPEFKICAVRVEAGGATGQ